MSLLQVAVSADLFGCFSSMSYRLIYILTVRHMMYCSFHTACDLQVRVFVLTVCNIRC